MNIITPFSDSVELTRYANPVSKTPIRLTYGVTQSGYDVTCEFDEFGEIGRIKLYPGTTELVSTIEHFNVPNNLQGQIIDKSTWARLGLSVRNTRVKPGWRGHLTIEVSNEGKTTLELLRGDPIAEIQFEEIIGPVIPYKGKYQDQGRGPKGAK